MNSKKIYRVLFAFYGVFALFAFYYNWQNGYNYAFKMTFVSLALMPVHYIVFKIFKWKPVYEIYSLYIIFITLASLLGSSYRFYNLYLYWDKVCHTFSGVLGAMLAYSLFGILRKKQTVEKELLPVMFVFVNAVNIAIAALWEEYEYLCLLIADNDAINHYSSGVHDTMGDIAVAIFGGIFATILLVHRYKTNKPNFVTNVYEKFYELNLKK